MLLLAEILMFIAGVKMLIQGELPTKLIKFIFGRGEYAATKSEVNQIAIAFLLPFPVAFIVGLVVGFIFQSTNAVLVVSLLELASIIWIYFWAKKILKNSAKRVKIDAAQAS